MIIIRIIIGIALLQKMALLREVSQPQAGSRTHSTYTELLYPYSPGLKTLRGKQAALRGSISFQRRLTVTRPCYDLKWLSQLEIPSKLSLHPGLTAAGMMDRKGESLDSSAAKPGTFAALDVQEPITKGIPLKHTLKPPLINTNISSAFTQWQQD